VGFAYAGPYKLRPAYRWACEVSVYLERGRRRSGGGRLLYEALFARLAERGFRTAVAGMTLPNDASAGLHRAWLRGGGDLPAHRLEARALARCRLGAACARRRRGPTGRAALRVTPRAAG